MSAQQANFGNGGKKAVHVKWAGKTIALGTFPSAEADEKCARAKALTRAWRSTMRPKPSRDWVMLELERLGVRVVSGRLGRKAGDEDDSDKKVDDIVSNSAVGRGSSIGWGSPDADINSLMQRRSSSLGLAIMSDNDLKRRTSMGSLGPVVGLDGDPTMPPHRPFVGGGSAAAYEAARADHYAQKREEQQRRASSLGLGLGGGNLGGGGGLPQMGMSVNPNQHYEMLKLHHMNLLNEIQETTLMMNLYQQQQLQQQQQQLQQQQQQAASEAASGLGAADPQMALLLQQQHHQATNPGIDSLYGGGLGSQRASLGLGSPSANQQMQLLRQQQMLHTASDVQQQVQQELLKGQAEQLALEDRLSRLKEDIARRQKEAEELEATAGKAPNGSMSGDKRKSEDDGDDNAKRVKLDDDGDDDDDDDDDDD